MKKLIFNSLFIAAFLPLSAQFNGITGTGQGITLTSYGNIPGSQPGIFPYGTGTTSIVVTQDFWVSGFNGGNNIGSPTLYWTTNSATLPAIDGAGWNTISGNFITGSVDGGSNDRVSFTLPVGTGAGQVPPGTDIMYYIRGSFGGTRYAYATVSNFPTTAPNAQNQLWKIRANGTTTYNAKRIEGNYADWQTNEVISNDGFSRNVYLTWDASNFYARFEGNFGDGDRINIGVDINPGTPETGNVGAFSGATFSGYLTPEYVVQSSGTTNLAVFPRSGTGWGGSTNIYSGSTLYRSGANCEIVIPRTNIGSPSTSSPIGFYFWLSNGSDEMFSGFGTDNYPASYSSSARRMRTAFVFNQSGTGTAISTDRNLDHNSSESRTLGFSSGIRNLYVSANTATTAASATTLSGGATIASGATLALSNSLNVGGNFDRHSSGTFTPGANAVKFNGSAAQTIQVSGSGGQATFQALEIDNANGVSMASSTNVWVNTNLTLTSGSFSIGAGNDLYVVNTISGAGSLAGTTTSDLFVYGSPSTLRFADGSRNLQFLWLEGVNGTSLASDLNVAFQLYIASNSFLSIGANTLTVGNGGFSGTGNLVGSTSSNLSLTGGTTPVYFATGGTNNYLKNLSLSGDALVTLNNQVNITGGSSPGLVTIGGTARLNAMNNLVLKSDANGTASLGQVTSSNTTPVFGNLTVERFIPQAPTLAPQTGRAWRLLSIPVTSTTATIRDIWAGGSAQRVASNTPSLSPLQQAGTGTLITGHNYITAQAANDAGYDWWESLTNGTQGSSASIRRHTSDATSGYFNSTSLHRPVINTVLNAADQAYMLFIRGDRTVTSGSGSTLLSQTGEARVGTVTVNVPASTSAKYFAFGNPYAATINFDAIQQRNAGTVKPIMHVWDAELAGSSNVGGYRTVAKVNGNWEDNILGQVANIQLINSSQGVILESNTTLSGQTMDVQEGDKVTAAPAVNPFGTESNSVSARLNVKLLRVNTSGSTTLVDGTTALFGPDYQSGYGDNLDVDKPSNFTGSLGIGLQAGGKNLAFEGRPNVKDGDKLFLNVSGLTQTNYTLAIETGNLAAEGRKALLLDKYLGTQTPIDLNGTVTRYGFNGNADAASVSASRFEILFSQPAVPQVQLNAVMAAQAQVKLGWTVSNIAGIKNFQVELSRDGITFRRIRTVLPDGAANGAYQWLHNTNAGGVHYYRITVNGNDGNTYRSNVAEIFPKNGLASFNVFPTIIPATGAQLTLQLTGFNAGVYRAELTDAFGRVVVSQLIRHAGGDANLNLQAPANLVPGIYNLRVFGGGTLFVKSLFRE